MKKILDKVLSLDINSIYNWATSSFVPKTRTITIGGVTQDLSADRTFPVGGGNDYLFYNVKWKGFRLNTLNTWRAPIPTHETFDNELFASYGSGTAPSGGFYTGASWQGIPDGYIVDSIQLEINWKLEGSVDSYLHIFIARSEATSGFIGNGVSNTIELVNQVVNVSSGSIATKYIKNLSVASHSLPTLAKSFTQITVRETSAADVYFSLGYNFIYKKI